MSYSIQTSSLQLNSHLLEADEWIRIYRLSGKHQDGSKLLLGAAEWDHSTGQVLRFTLEYSLSRQRPAGLFAKQFEKRNELLSHLAFNGSPSILPSVVKQHALDDLFQNAPLGFLLSHSYVMGAPIYSLPVLLVSETHDLSVRKIDLSHGITLKCNSRTIEIPAENRNLTPDTPLLPDFSYYDAAYAGDTIPGNGRVVIQLAGNSIARVHHTGHQQNPSYRPAGLVLSIRSEALPPMWDMKDKELEIIIPGLENAVFGVQSSYYWERGKGEVETDARLSTYLARDPEPAQTRYLLGLTTQKKWVVLTLPHSDSAWRGLSLQELPELLEEMNFQWAIGLDAANGSSLYRGVQRIRLSEKDPDEFFNPFATDTIQSGAVSNAFILYRDKLF